MIFSDSLRIFLENKMILAKGVRDFCKFDDLVIEAFRLSDNSPQRLLMIWLQIANFLSFGN